MACCNEPGGACCSRKRGVCNAGVWSILFLVVGLVFIAVAIAVPIIVQKMIDQGICDQVCIPSSSDELWKINNWATNYNATVNPEEFLTFYAYNLTNPDDFQNGALPIITVMGPYVYQVSREKYNISWSEDNAQVAYETFEQYHFRQDLSNGTDSDILTSISLPYLASVATVYYRGGHLPIQQTLTSYCQQNDWHTKSADEAACLFQRRSIQQTFFNAHSSVLNIANFFFFPNHPIDLNFQIFFNCTSHDDCHVRYTKQHNAGLGGVCRPPKVPSLFYDCEWSANQGNSTVNFATIQKTGHQNINDMSQLVQWLGNTSLTGVWNSSVTTKNVVLSNSTTINIDNGVTTTTTTTSSVTTVVNTLEPEYIRGTDHLQFHPSVSQDDILTIFDDIPMRHVDMQYIRDTNYLGVDMLRFVVTPELYADTDPFFYGGGPDAINGLLDVSSIPSVRYGSLTPVFASRPYQWHADPVLRTMYNCTNCPDFNYIDSLPLDEVGSYLDVEPNTGKVLRGQKRVQVNAHINGPLMFNNSAAPLYARLPNVYLPVFWFENGATMTPHQSDLVKDGLTQINLAHAVRLAAIVAGSVVGVLSIVAAAYLAYKFHVIGGWRGCCQPNNTHDTLEGEGYQAKNTHDTLEGEGYHPVNDSK